jgi:hypothetical protein
VIRRLLFLLAACLSASNVPAQSDSHERSDTTGESRKYPTGDAVDVYRAALDLLYMDGPRHPSVIVMHDTVEFGALGAPCPRSCANVRPHKSKIDTSAILAFEQRNPRRLRISRFEYRIPIVLVSYDEFNGLARRGEQYLIDHHLLTNESDVAISRGFSLRFPGAWGLTQLSRVGFNHDHTQALMQVWHWCGGESSCASIEVLYLKRVSGSWRVIERIPNYAAVYTERAGLRYRGPAGSTPAESEIVGDTTASAAFRSEWKDSRSVYRAVLDTLYDFQGSTPRMVVWTDVARIAEDSTPTPTTRIDSALLQKYRFLGSVRAIPEPDFTYRLPVKILLRDSISRLETIREPVANKPVEIPSHWTDFTRRFPGAWGMVGFSRVAFDLTQTQAMVYSHHQCGPGCGNADTWVLERKGERWQVVERMPRHIQSFWDPDLFPLRYVGLDAKPRAYQHRRAYVRLTNAVTNGPLSFLRLSARRLSPRRNSTKHQIYVADSRGLVDLGGTPFTGIIALRAGCPDQSRPDSIYSLQLLFSPGADTTLESRLDFRQCFHRDEPHRLTGAQAFISETEAQFVFPLRDVPRSPTAPGTTEYFWTIALQSQEPDFSHPTALWLRVTQGPNELARSLQDLIAGKPLDVMFECRSCDGGAYYAAPNVDHQNIYAHVDSGRIVFTVRGRKAVNYVLQKAPSAVTFSSTVLYKTPVGEHISYGQTESQAVLVNCRTSNSTGASRRRCDAPDNPRRATLRADSTAWRNPTVQIDSFAPRKIKVVALTYDGASLVRNLDVRIRSEDLKKPTVSKSTGPTGSFWALQAPRDSITIESLCPKKDRSQPAISGALALYLAAGRDTTVQLIVDPRRCTGSGGRATPF